MVLCPNQVIPTPTVPIQNDQTTGGIGLITIVGNLVLLARGVVPQHQEYLHDAIVSTFSSIHILHSPDVTEQGSDQLDSIHPASCLSLLNPMGLISHSHIYRDRVRYPLVVLIHYIYLQTKNR
jgi:hypothetical protein